MRRLLAALSISAVCAFASPLAASADPPPIGPNPGNQPAGAEHSGNCVAIFSAIFVHNGQVVWEQARSGVRGEIIQGLQAANRAGLCGRTPRP
jgi:hypothetical protein